MSREAPTYSSNSSSRYGTEEHRSSRDYPSSFARGGHSASGRRSPPRSDRRSGGAGGSYYDREDRRVEGGDSRGGGNGRRDRDDGRGGGSGSRVGWDRDREGGGGGGGGRDHRDTRDHRDSREHRDKDRDARDSDRSSRDRPSSSFRPLTARRSASPSGQSPGYNASPRRDDYRGPPPPAQPPVVPASAARLKGDSKPPTNAIRFSSSLTESAAPAPEPESAPPEDMVEGVDGEWDEEEDLEEADGLEDGEEDEMAKMMGFGGFGTSKGKHVPSNQTGDVVIKKQRTWRQYMNRRGGFNRPLDKIK